MASFTPLAVAGSGTSVPSTVLYLPGASGNYVSTPDTAALDITGDLDLRIDFAAADWTPGSINELVSKYAGGDISFQWYLDTAGKLVFSFTEDGTTFTVHTSSVALGFTDGDRHQLRVQFDADNGSSQNQATFEHRSDGDIEASSGWTQLGTVRTDADAATIHSGGGNLEVGGRGGGALPATGKVYRAQVYDGLAGTLVADFRGDIGNVSPRYRDSTGKVWTLNGSAYTWTER